jgi:hypothetical protein
MGFGWEWSLVVVIVVIVLGLVPVPGLDAVGGVVSTTDAIVLVFVVGKECNHGSAKQLTYLAHIRRRDCWRSDNVVVVVREILGCWF